MTVKELIDALQAWDPDALVYTEGCDCYGPAGGVSTHNFRGVRGVLIERNDQDQIEEAWRQRYGQGRPD